MDALYECISDVHGKIEQMAMPLDLQWWGHNYPEIRWHVKDLIPLIGSSGLTFLS